MVLIFLVGNLSVCGIYDQLNVESSLGSRVGSEPWYRYSVSIVTRADHSMPNSTVASTK